MVDVLFVLNIASKLFQHVFEGYDARHPAVLVGDRQDVGAPFQEFVQQQVAGGGLGDEAEGLGDGPHVLVVWSVDRFGRRSIIGERTFVLDNASP